MDQCSRQLPLPSAEGRQTLRPLCLRRSAPTHRGGCSCWCSGHAAEEAGRNERPGWASKRQGGGVLRGWGVVVVGVGEGYPGCRRADMPCLILWCWIPCTRGSSRLSTLAADRCCISFRHCLNWLRSETESETLNSSILNPKS